MNFNLTLDLWTKLHFLCVSMMVGVIWVIQLIHYPAFLKVDARHFPEFHRQHTFWMGVIAGPAMVIELLLGIYLVAHFPQRYAISLAMTVFCFWVTFHDAVPAHERLGVKFSDKTVLELIRVNRFRAIAWSINLFNLMLPL